MQTRINITAQVRLSNTYSMQSTSIWAKSRGLLCWCKCKRFSLLCSMVCCTSLWSQRFITIYTIIKLKSCCCYAIWSWG